MLLFLSISLTCVSLLLMLSVYYNYKHAIIILRTIDGIEDALDLLDEKYASVSDILEIPLFYDSPQIRKVHEDLKASREVILNVANLLGKVEDDKEETQQ